MEDDVLAPQNYFQKIKQFIEQSDKTDPSWIILNFEQYSRGILWKSQYVPDIVDFIQIFYQDKPVDWLIYNFIDLKTCDKSVSLENNGVCKDKFSRHYKGFLFTHIGKMSSLEIKNINGQR